jgi:cell division protein FtsI/penicillin-binding protein 2
MTRKPAISQWRYVGMSLVFVVFGGIIISKLFIIQVIDHQQYEVKAQNQYGSSKTVPATRGTIRSSDGYDLASNQPAYWISADPQLISNPADTAKKVIQALAVTSPTPTPADGTIIHQASSSANESVAQKQIQDLTDKLSNKKSQYVSIARKVESDRTQKVRDLHLKGLSFDLDEKRYYPEGTLASQVLGFVGSGTKGEDYGYYGIEGFFNGELKGKDGSVELQADPNGNPIPVGTYLSQPVEEGANITLTINRGLQYMIEDKLKKGVEDNKAIAGSAILMEPATGRILAMANYPTYTPSNWQDSTVQDKQLFKNDAIQDTYEPGSVMKSFTVATGLQLGIMTPTTTYNSAPYKVGDDTINTADHKYYGTATVTEMLEHSDNTGAAQFGLLIGRDNFLTWLHKIGLDRPTGITLQGEANSQILPAADWLPITLATSAFGQGFSVTPLQLLEMMSTIANGGVQMKPTIVLSKEQAGKTVQVKPEQVGRVYSEATTQQMDSMLQDVVEKGEFHRLALQGYHIAGKTSTAQIPLASGGYDPSNVITTFVGYAPATNPKFIMLVKLDKPAILNSALTVVPVWMNMATELFRYYGIAPEPTTTPTR